MAERSLEDLSLVELLAAKITFPRQILLNEFLRLVWVGVELGPRVRLVVNLQVFRELHRWHTNYYTSAQRQLYGSTYCAMHHLITDWHYVSTPVLHHITTMFHSTSFHLAHTVTCKLQYLQHWHRYERRRHFLSVYASPSTAKAIRCTPVNCYSHI